MLRAGDTLKVINRNAAFDQLSFNFFKNAPVTLLLNPGQAQSAVIAIAEPAPIPVSSPISPWINGRIVVLNHSQVDVSDSNGRIEITNLPVGEVSFRVSHESARMDAVTVAGEPQTWSRSRFKLELQAGENQLGDVLVAPECFH